TDNQFHNTGVPVAKGASEDLGRARGVVQLKADPFNCLGPYSDARPEDCIELQFLAETNPEVVGAFKTPSLRGVAERGPYMQLGQIPTLAEVIDHYAAAPAAAFGHSELRPVDLSSSDRAALIAFLKTLDPEQHRK
ncbi:MAG: methylamine utilization protein, partial [Candidatus Saccharibacteria bacterium]|nr:methylamine utilization protein [Pseudorhodobacter sp.]